VSDSKKCVTLTFLLSLLITLLMKDELYLTACIYCAFLVIHLRKTPIETYKQIVIRKNEKSYKYFVNERPSIDFFLFRGYIPLDWALLLLLVRFPRRMQHGVLHWSCWWRCQQTKNANRIYLLIYAYPNLHVSNPTLHKSVICVRTVWYRRSH